MTAAPTTCLLPVWPDGAYRVRCSTGSAGVCARHGKHQAHPNDGRPCELHEDGYCGTHGVYVAPLSGGSDDSAILPTSGSAPSPSSTNTGE